MNIPEEAKFALEKLKENNFEAFLVGGCVRDLLSGRDPEDWDVATNAKPEEISKIFPESFCENKFFTVTVKTKSQNEKLKEIEITTFRSEAKYEDRRHPGEIKFAKTIEEDLSRRDFTVNAIALGMPARIATRARELARLRSVAGGQNLKFTIVDPFSGQKDLKKKIIRAVGDPKERFSEDALRMIRAVRFASVLGFEIEKETSEAIKENANWLEEISKERVRDELVKIIMSDRASEGIEMLRNLGLLKHIIPELEEGFLIGQNKHHIFDCYQHSLLSLKYAASKKFNFFVRFASLLHDIGKPRSKRGEGSDSTFYNHEIIGANMAKKILERLKFPKKEIEKITRLVRYHLFYYNVGEVSEASVRRLVKNVGPENINELLEVRMADRIGSGVPKAEPYKLRHLKYLIEKVAEDPISAKMLKVNGKEVMEIFKIAPGPKVGQVLDILLAMVLQDPKKNDKNLLEQEIRKLGDLKDEELKKMAEASEKEIEKTETKKDDMTKGKYWVS